MPVSSLPLLRFPSAAVIPDAVRALLQLLNTGGAVTRYAGGCVRDALLGLTPGDVDFATTLRPDAVMETLRARGIRVLPTGIEHGTVTALIDGKPVEITTLRRDTQTDGRHAVVEFSDDWRIDAERRDFTINALYADDDGMVHDLVGGLADLTGTVRVRFVGEAAARVGEDFLRILRFYRFAGRSQPNAPLDESARAACRLGAHGLTSLSGERIGAEMRKILALPDPGAILTAMEHDGVLAGLSLTPRATVLAALDTVPPALRLVALSFGTDIALLAERWRLTRLEHAFTSKLTRSLAELLEKPTVLSANTLRYEHQEISTDALNALHSAVSGVSQQDFWAKTALPAPLPPLSAALMKQGLNGKELGEALKKAENHWISSEFSAEIPALLAAAQKCD